MGKTATKPLTLADFAAANPARASDGCWMCKIPERAEIEAARKNGIMPSQIRRWLVESKGYTSTEASREKISYHFSAGHAGQK